MKRTILTPRDAAWLTDTFARNRALYAGFRMEDDSDKDGDKPDGEKDQKPDGDKGGGSDDADKDKGDKPLGENGEKALRAERDARKALESQLSDLKKGLLTALGGDAEKDAEDGDAVAKIQQRLDDMQHENTVLALANEHRITDKDDLDLLRATKDTGALTKLAARLATDEDDKTDGGSKKRTPKPDRSQGGGDDADTKPSVARGREMFAASRKKKSA